MLSYITVVQFGLVAWLQGRMLNVKLSGMTDILRRYKRSSNKYSADKAAYAGLILLSPLLCSNGIAYASEDPQMRRLFGPHFKLFVPSNSSIKHRQLDDFETYSISLSSKATPLRLSIYVGNHPNFPQEQYAAGKDVEIKVISAENVSIVSYWRGKTLIGKEILFSYISDDPDLERLNIPMKDRKEYIHCVIPLSKIADVSFSDKVLSGMQITPHKNSRLPSKNAI